MGDFISVLSLSMGIILFAFAIIIAIYVFQALATMRFLKFIGYEKAWMAWISIANIIALVSAVEDEGGTMELFGKKMPSIIFKLYWLIAGVITIIPFIGALIAMAVRILGFGTICTYAYAIAEEQYLEDTRVMGYVSGLIPLIAYVKFLMYK